MTMTMMMMIMTKMMMMMMMMMMMIMMKTATLMMIMMMKVVSVPSDLQGGTRDGRADFLHQPHAFCSHQLLPGGRRSRSG
jgi:hypothetical protein